MGESEEKRLHLKAKRHVQNIKGFYIHAIIFALVSALLLIINLTTDPSVLWALIVFAAWGVGVAGHYIGVFGVPFTSGVLGQEWEEREIERFKNRN